MSELLQNQGVTDEMLTESLETEQFQITEGQFISFLLQQHPNWASGIAKVYSETTHGAANSYQNAMILPRSCFMVPDLMFPVPTGLLGIDGNGITTALGGIFDQTEWGQEECYFGLNSFYSEGSPIDFVRDPIAIPLLDFEYAVTQGNLDLFVDLLNTTNADWYMFWSGGGSVHVIVDKPTEPFELPEFWGQFIADTMTAFPAFNNPIYGSLCSQLFEAGCSPSYYVELGILAQTLYELTKHVDDSAKLSGRAFPLDLRYLGHCMERLSKFLELQYMNPFLQPEEIDPDEGITLPSRPGYEDCAGVSYLRLTKKHGIYPYLIAMRNMGKVTKGAVPKLPNLVLGL